MKSKIRYLILDIDDVVYDCPASLLKYVQNTMPGYANATMESLNEIFESVDGFFKLTPEIVMTILTVQPYCNMALFPYVKNSLYRLKNDGIIFDNFALSSTPDGAKETRTYYLNRDLPGIFTEMILKLGDKGELIQELLERRKIRPEETLFADDLRKNILSAQNKNPGLNLAYRRNLRNAHVPNIPGAYNVKDFLEIEALIRGR